MAKGKETVYVVYIWCICEIERGDHMASLLPWEESMLQDCYRMLEMLRVDSELKKVYVDVDFYGLIAELEGLREDLRTAEILFPD